MMSGRPIMYQDAKELQDFLAYLKVEYKACVEPSLLQLAFNSALGAGGVLCGMFNTPETDTTSRNLRAYGTVVKYPEKIWEIAQQIFTLKQIEVLYDYMREQDDFPPEIVCRCMLKWGLEDAKSSAKSHKA